MRIYSVSLCHLKLLEIRHGFYFWGVPGNLDTSLPSPCTPVCLDFHQLIHSPSLQSEDAQIQGMNTVIWGVHSSVQLLSCVWLFATPWTVAHQASLSITNSRSLLKLMSIELVMDPTISSSTIPFFSHLQSFPASASFPLSQFFPSDGQSIGALASAPNEYSGLFSSRINWFDFLNIPRVTMITNTEILYYLICKVKPGRSVLFSPFYFLLLSIWQD